MVKLVDTTDLSSVGPQGPCGFESHLDYKKQTYSIGPVPLDAVDSSALFGPIAQLVRATDS